MQVVEFLVGSDGVHVGVHTISWLDVIFSQCESLPLRKRVYNFRFLVAEVLDWECNGALHAVEIVVDAESLKHEQRCCDAAQAQLS